MAASQKEAESLSVDLPLAVTGKSKKSGTLAKRLYQEQNIKNDEVAQLSRLEEGEDNNSNAKVQVVDTELMSPDKSFLEKVDLSNSDRDALLEMLTAYRTNANNSIVSYADDIDFAENQKKSDVSDEEYFASDDDEEQQETNLSPKNNLMLSPSDTGDVLKMLEEYKSSTLFGKRRSFLNKKSSVFRDLKLQSAKEVNPEDSINLYTDDEKEKSQNLWALFWFTLALMLAFVVMFAFGGIIDIKFFVLPDFNARIDEIEKKIP